VGRFLFAAALHASHDRFGAVIQPWGVTEYIVTEPCIGYRFCSPSHPDSPPRISDN